MHTTTKALVLRSVDYKESDKILTLLTQDMGKLTASARGPGGRAALWRRAVSCCAGRRWSCLNTGAAGP